MSLKECYYGNQEKGINPVPQFVKIMQENPEVWTVAQNIEGLICRRGIHAAGVLPVNEEFVQHNALMRAPSGSLVSQWDLHESESVGNVKYDLLTTDGLDRIRTCLDLLLKYDMIEWKDNLRDTYEYYIGLDRLDYTSPDMWKMVEEGKILNLFQYSSGVGLSSANVVKPTNLDELAACNNIMRLMAGESGVMPLTTYAENKHNPQLWYKEMDKYNLTKEEIELMEKHLKKLHGVCDSQEAMMLLSMDTQIAGFSILEANRT